MTVITKPLTGVAEKKEKPEGEDKNEDAPSLVQVELPEEDEPDLRLQLLSARASRVGRVTHTCLVLTLILASVMGLLAGVHIYRNMFLHNNYRGVCRIPLARGIRPDDTMVAAKFQTGEKSPGDSSFMDMFAMFNQGTPHNIKMKEVVEETDEGTEFDFELDLETNQFESFELPEIFSGRYMHDFKVNYTAIIDGMSGVCFILPLDRTVIPPPTTIFDILEKMRRGTFDIDYNEIRKTYRVMGPQLETLDAFGFFIPRACSDKKTFRVEQMTTPILKRSVNEIKSKFGEFIGRNIVTYNIEGTL